MSFMFAHGCVTWQTSSLVLPAGPVCRCSWCFDRRDRDRYGDYEDHVCDSGRLFQRFSPCMDHSMLRKMLLTCSC